MKRWRSVEQIAKLKIDMASADGQADPQRAEIDAKIAENTARLDEIARQLARAHQNKCIKTRFKILEDREKELSAEYERLERMLFFD